jgi:hypothetical protein
MSDGHATNERQEFDLAERTALFGEAVIQSFEAYDGTTSMAR